MLLAVAGFCAAYLIFIKENLASLSSVPANLCVAILLPLQLGLSLFRDVHALAPFSLTADIANCVGVLFFPYGDTFHLHV